MLLPIQDIPANTLLKPEYFRIDKVRSDLVQEGTLSSFDTILNKYSKTLIVAHRPIYTEHITELVANEDIRDHIPAGFRGVTMRVDKLMSFEGWIAPGARVDVASFTSLNSEQVLVPVVHNVLVLSVERKTNSNKADEKNIPETITLVANPTEASRIQYAQQTGLLSLTLRGTPDNGKVGEISIIGKNDFNPNATLPKPEMKYKGKLKVGNEEFLIDEQGNIVNPEEAHTLRSTIKLGTR